MSGKPVRIAVVGYGYWGPNLVRNFHENQRAEMAVIVDSQPKALERASRTYPFARTTTDLQSVLEGDEVDAVVLATPADSHHPIGMEVLRSGKHLLVEKPLTTNPKDGEELLALAKQQGLALMVDHTLLYTGAVTKIRELIDSGELGKLYYYDSVRINLGLFHTDVNVLWDLAVHDLSIIDYLLPGRPQRITAFGVSHIPGQLQDMAYLTLEYPDSLVAHVHVNWLAPAKVRRTLIGGEHKMVIYDDVEPSEKVRVFDRGATVVNDTNLKRQAMISYRDGDVWSPKLDQTEGLKGVVEDFLGAIIDRTTPRSNAEMGLRVVELLSAAEQSMVKGAAVDLAGARV